MKLSNIFKKATKTVAKANIENLEKNQLEKVVGGVATVTTKPIGGASSPGGGAAAAAYA